MPASPPASLLALLESEAARLPRPARAEGESFSDVLARTLDGYVGRIATLNASDWATRPVQDAHARMCVLTTRLQEAFAAAHGGQPSEAASAFDAGLAAVRDEVESAVSVQLGADTFKTRYRVRSGASNCSHDRAALFHVPFEVATKLIGSGRYNPAGVPVLYLGGSLITCWHEARRPTHDVWAAAIRLCSSATIRVLNLAYRTAQVAALLRAGLAANSQAERPTTRLATSLAVAWPLLAACSFEAREADAERPEYLIPQQLMRWAYKRGDVDGIRYFSTRIADGDAAIDESANFVFPTRSEATLGFDPTLAKRFEMTPPVFWAALPAGLEALSHETEEVRMSVTTFGRLEEELRRHPFAPVDAA